MLKHTLYQFVYSSMTKVPMKQFMRIKSSIQPSYREKTILTRHLMDSLNNTKFHASLVLATFTMLHQIPYNYNYLQEEFCLRPSVCSKLVSFPKSPDTLSVKLPFYILFTPLRSVDCQGAECTKSMYSVLWVLPIPRAFSTKISMV